MKPAHLVREFHAAFNLPMDLPVVDDATRVLRADLINEESEEVQAALGGGSDLTAIAQELADLVYVAYGTAITYGINLDAVIAAVHAANMSKLGADGKPILREDGKVMKGPNFAPADIAGVLARGKRRSHRRVPPFPGQVVKSPTATAKILAMHDGVYDLVILKHANPGRVRAVTRVGHGTLMSRWRVVGDVAA